MIRPCAWYVLRLPVLSPVLRSLRSPRCREAFQVWVVLAAVQRVVAGAAPRTYVAFAWVPNFVFLFFFAWIARGICWLGRQCCVPCQLNSFYRALYTAGRNENTYCKERSAYILFYFIIPVGVKAKEGSIVSNAVTLLWKAKKGERTGTIRNWNYACRFIFSGNHELSHSHLQTLKNFCDLWAADGFLSLSMCGSLRQSGHSTKAPCRCFKARSSDFLRTNSSNYRLSIELSFFFADRAWCSSFTSLLISLLRDDKRECSVLLAYFPS